MKVTVSTGVMALAFAIAFSAFAGEGDTIMWIAASANHSWHEPTNWDLGRVPEDGDTVVLTSPDGSYYTQITTTATNTVPETGKFKKLTINGQHTLSLKGWNTKVVAEEIVMTKKPVYGSNISCPSCTKTDTNRVWIVVDRLTVSSGCTIKASGCEPWVGPCWADVESPSGPPAHASLGTSGNGKICGSITEPTLPGGGGGTASGQKAIGGGVIRIEAGTIQVDGSISASGGSCPYGQPAAAGGSVYITCQTIKGSGTVSANGGGYESSTTGGCGGAGRVAVYYDADLQEDVVCNVHFSARGGYDGHDGAKSDDPAGRFTMFSRCGTLYFSDDQFVRRNGMLLSGKIYYGPSVTRFNVIDVPGDFEIVNCLPEIGGEGAYVKVGGSLALRGTSARKYGLWTADSKVPVSIGGDLVVKGAMLRIENGGDLTVGGDVFQQDGTTAQGSGEVYVGAAPTNGLDGAVCGARVTVFGDWKVGAYGMVTSACDPTNGAVVAMTAKSFTLPETGVLSANGTGWGAGKGPGRSSGLTGASYAGKGCNYNGGWSGTLYGNRRRPLQPGSGSSGKRGGGLVWLETSRRMDLNGNVTAKGADWANYKGAGSGGSIFLRCGSCLSGTNGTISANGGNGGGLGGSGGGGRVAVYYRDMDANCAITAEALGGTYSSDTNFWGQAGSTYWHQIKGLMLLVR